MATNDGIRRAETVCFFALPAGFLFCCFLLFLSLFSSPANPVHFPPASSSACVLAEDSGTDDEPCALRRNPATQIRILQKTGRTHSVPPFRKEPGIVAFVSGMPECRWHRPVPHADGHICRNSLKSSLPVRAGPVFL